MSEKILTKKDLSRCLNRYVLSRQMCFNYENMQAGGWVWAIYPALEKIYGDQPEVIREKNKQYFQFYNTHPWEKKSTSCFWLQILILYLNFVDEI